MRTVERRDRIIDFNREQIARLQARVSALEGQLSELKIILSHKNR